ncbi:unnamed protein product [Dicrocoelium dendriticum]|nr:unnamed protein product [Dicrocoelium dendriticum]
MLPKLCGCKGIRVCGLCSSANAVFLDEKDGLCFNLCCICRLAYHHAHQCGLSKNENEFLFTNVDVMLDFVSESEESLLIDSLDKDPWSLSQSGRRKQDYGPKVNFKRRRISYDGFSGLPSYSCFLVNRINKTISCNPQMGQISFQPVELCNLEYCPDRTSCIVPHLDDVWLWGSRLITLNLCSDTVLTFTLPDSSDSPEVLSEIERIRGSLSESYACKISDNLAVRVPLPKRSLVIVDGPARYVWFHSIRPSDIRSRRIAMTFRELSELFLPPVSGMVLNADQQIGKHLLEIAASYKGVPRSVS